MAARSSGLPPSIDGDCRILILGSMPSVRSLAAGAYYAHPQNRFWPLMARLLTGEGAPPASYAARLKMLLAHQIALWDAVKSCERAGSLDAAIKNAESNDIAALLAAYPAISAICCNGAKAYEFFCRANRSLLELKDIKLHRLPSTSPANAKWRLPMLLEAWGSVLQEEHCRLFQPA